jgi:RIO-like serine/threonine protein kinase
MSVSKKVAIVIDSVKYDLLSEGANGQVVELTQDTCAKIFELGEAQREADLMKVANSINGLLCNHVKVEPTSGYSKELLVMERLYPLQYRAIAVTQREAFFNKFLSELKKLHSNGFAHWDVKRPAHVAKERLWDNIVLTPQGLRLIDTGNSVLQDNYAFEKACEEDIKNAMEFKEVFLIP